MERGDNWEGEVHGARLSAYPEGRGAPEAKKIERYPGEHVLVVSRQVCIREDHDETW